MAAVVEIFDNDMHSLSETVGGIAERCFYPGNNAINTKSNQYNEEFEGVIRSKFDSEIPNTKVEFLKP